MDDAPAGVTLAILAGGAGSRMGRPKGLLDLGGVPILEWILTNLKWPGPTLLVTAPRREHPPGSDLFDREVSDPVAGRGPLQGIITALESARTDQTIILPVDMPLFGSGALSWLAIQQSAGGVLLERQVEGRRQIEPMPLMVRQAALPTIQAMLANGANAVRDLASANGFNVIPAPAEWDAKIWSNLNSPDDLLALREALRVSLGH